MSFACNGDALVGGDLNGDGLLDETEFLAYLAGSSGNDAGCDTTAFNFARVGCECLYFGADFDDDLIERPPPLDCEPDCSVVPLAEMYLASDFPDLICAKVADFYIDQGCIAPPTASPTGSLAPTKSPTARPTMSPTPDPWAVATTSNTTTVAVLATLVALLAMGVAAQFLYARHARKAYDAQIKAQKAYIKKEKKRREKDEIAKRKRFSKKPVLGALQENGDGVMELTPTNLTREDDALLKIKLKQPGHKFHSTFFATSITIGNATGGEEADDEGEGGAVEEARLLE